MSFFRSSLVVVAGSLTVAACGPPAEAPGPLLVTPWRKFPNTWRGEVLVLDEVRLHEKVTVEPCTTVSMGHFARLHVLKNIEVRGTSECPVVFTSRVEGIPWLGVTFDARADEPSLLEHVLFEDGGGATAPQPEDRRTRSGVLDVDGPGTVSLRYLRFMRSRTSSLFLRHAPVTVEGPLRVEASHPAVIAAPLEMVHLLPDVVAERMDAPFIQAVGGLPRLQRPRRWATRGAPIQLDSHLVIEGNTLTLGPGVVLNPQPSGRGDAVTVGPTGRLEALGEPSAPVVISSRYEPGRAHPTFLYWDALSFQSRDNLLRDTLVRLGGGQTLDQGAVRVDAGAQVRLERVSFRENRGCDLRRADATAEVEAVDTRFTPCVP